MRACHSASPLRSTRSRCLLNSFVCSGRGIHPPNSAILKRWQRNACATPGTAGCTRKVIGYSEDSGPEEPRRCQCPANLPKFGTGSRVPRHSLRLADTQPLHARLKRSALHAKTGGRAARPAEHPVRLFQSAQQTLPFGDVSIRPSLSGR